MGELDFLIKGISSVSWQQLIMYAVGAILIIIGIAKKLEPSLLIPMGLGAILVNIPASGALGQAGAIEWLFKVGIEASEIMPLLLFIGIGAMLDFGPLLSNPKLIFIGAAAQAGIFLTIILSVVLGFDIKEAASIGIIGAADGPTSILVATKLIPDSDIYGAIMVVAYCYMALVPLIQPIVIKGCTTKKERLIKMEYNPKNVTKGAKIAFPVIITIVAGLLAPESVSLVGFLMFGNLIRECGVLNSLSETAQKSLANIVTIFLGISIASQMQAEQFLKPETLLILGLGLFAFIFDTAGGVLFAKFINLFSKNKVNPMIGAAGVSAVPMAARVVHKEGVKEDPTNFLLMHSVGVNVFGQIASVIAGGMILNFFMK